MSIEAKMRLSYGSFSDLRAYFEYVFSGRGLVPSIYQILLLLVREEIVGQAIYCVAVGKWCCKHVAGHPRKLDTNGRCLIISHCCVLKHISQRIPYWYSDSIVPF